MRTEDSPTETFVRLLSAHEHTVMAYILSLVPNWHDAKDIAQDTRLQLWRQFGEFDATKDFGAWARTIAYWQVKRFRSERGRDKVQFGEQALEACAEVAEAASSRTAERQAALARCLQRLDSLHRRLLGLFYSGMHTAREIAQREGRSYEATRKDLLRTRLRLRECIERMEERL